MSDLFPEYPQILNVDDACELLRCGRNNLYRLLNSGNAENKLKCLPKWRSNVG